MYDSVLPLVFSGSGRVSCLICRSLKRFEIIFVYDVRMASQVVLGVKNPPAMQEPQVRSLSREDPPEEEMATHSSVLAWRNPMDRGTGGLQSKESQRVGHD